MELRRRERGAMVVRRGKGLNKLKFSLLIQDDELC